MIWWWNYKPIISEKNKILRGSLEVVRGLSLQPQPSQLPHLKIRARRLLKTMTKQNVWGSWHSNSQQPQRMKRFTPCYWLFLGHQDSASNVPCVHTGDEGTTRMYDGTHEWHSHPGPSQIQSKAKHSFVSVSVQHITNKTNSKFILWASEPELVQQFQ